MNASELADKLSDKTMRDYIVFEYLPEIVSMLRKQQESIEGLNRDYDLLFAEHQLLLKKEWVGLTDDDKVLIKYDANFNQFMTAGEYADRVQQLTEARLKDLNT